jgi:hypothetical protein
MMSPIPVDTPEQNIQFELEQPHIEMLSSQDGKCWQVMTGVTHAEYEALPIEPPDIKVGIGNAAMDDAYFKRSPGADADGPVEVLERYGHSWSYIARPCGAPTMPAGREGPRQIQVDKHHVVIFRAGRELGYLTLPDGSEYVHVIRGDAPLLLPDGWTLRSERLDEDLTIELPAPATVFFFPNGDSYQGPF